jgi:lysophospholipase L1-like esterase
MTWTNAAISGGTITSGLASSAGCIGDTDFGENPDYIIIEGGTNDADCIGAKDAEGNMPTAFGTLSLSKYTNEFDRTTFCGAVDELFRRVVTNYKGAKIGFIIAHKMGGYLDTDGAGLYYTAERNNRRYYFETIIQLCKKWGIPYIDLWEGCYLNPMMPEHNSGADPFYYNNDFQHLTAKGYDYITPMIEKWMETL